jgi:putative tryptophan/tyrosine transport system substrate-binding protein
VTRPTGSRHFIRLRPTTKTMRRSIRSNPISVAASWPLRARAQQQPMPVIGFFHSVSPGPHADLVRAFRKGLNETGYVEGQNVTVKDHWLEGQYDRMPALAADLRRVAVIATPASMSITLAAKAATATTPIVFSVGEDPVQVGRAPASIVI